MCKSQKSRTKKVKLTVTVESSKLCCDVNTTRILHAAEKDELIDSIISWAMPLNLSQSHLGDRNTPSNACTIIALHVADLMHRFDVMLPYQDENKNWVLPHSRKEVFSPEEISARNQMLCLPEDFVRLFLNGILEGNKTHEEALRPRIKEASDSNKELRDTFTVPEAIMEIRRSYLSRIHEIDYVAVEGAFEPNFPGIIRAGIENEHLIHLKRIYFIVIAVQRAVMMAYDRETDTVALFDSHSHRRPAETVTKDEEEIGPQGGIIACASARQLKKFSNWMIRVIYPELKNGPSKTFEVSCVQMVGDRRPSDAPGVVFYPRIKKRIFRKPGLSHRVVAKEVKQKWPSLFSQFQRKRSYLNAFNRGSSGSDSEDDTSDTDSDDGLHDAPWDAKYPALREDEHEKEWHNKSADEATDSIEEVLNMLESSTDDLPTSYVTHALQYYNSKKYEEEGGRP